MAIIKPTMKSALAGLNKAIQQLRTVEANAKAREESAGKAIKMAENVFNEVKATQSEVQKSAQMEANHAAAVASKIEALVSPETMQAVS